MIGKYNGSARFIRYDTLESIAQRKLYEYDPTLLTGEPRAIPIEKIAEKHFGLSIEFHCLRKSGVILGETVFDDSAIPVYDYKARRYDLIFVRGGTIILDESLLRDKADGRLRFTCAHELAHWLIHREIYSGSGATAALLNMENSKTAIERQANILGTALLMPGCQVKKAFYKTQKSDPTAALAELFGVSKQAMSICLKDHNLI